MVACALERSSEAAIATAWLRSATLVSEISALVSAIRNGWLLSFPIQVIIDALRGIGRQPDIKPFAKLGQLQEGLASRRRARVRELVGQRFPDDLRLGFAL